MKPFIRMDGLNQPPSILDTAALLADATRCRILQLLDEHELTVSELCAVLQMPQSTVSRHLKTLNAGGWVQARREGTSNLYRQTGRNGADGSLWRLIREQLTQERSSRRDRERLRQVLAERLSRSEQFFAKSAGDWDLLRDELFGSRFDLQALTWLLDPTLVVGDLACGTGRVAEALAPAVGHVVAIDQSVPMIEAARQRLGHFENIDVREGRLEALPLADQSLDLGALFLALHLSSDPVRVLEEVRRVLRPGGRLLVVDLLPHGREELRQNMGHVWLGFSAEQLAEQLTLAGFDGSRQRYAALPEATSATGPALFVSTVACP